MKWLEKIKSNRKASHRNAMGIRLARAGRLEEAIGEFRQALEHRRDDGLVRYNLGLALSNGGKTRKALNEFKPAIRFEPTCPDSYFALATCYAILGPDWKSIACYQAYLDLVPDGEKSDVARRRLREKSYCSQDFDEGEWLEAARRNHDELARECGIDGARLGVQTAEKQALSPAEARKVTIGMRAYLMNAVHAKSKEWASAHFQASVILFEQKKYRAAILQMIEGIESFPFFQGAIISLASCYALVGEPERAVRLVSWVDREKLEPEELVGLGELLSGLQEGGHL